MPHTAKDLTPAPAAPVPSAGTGSVAPEVKPTEPVTAPVGSVEKKFDAIDGDPVAGEVDVESEVLTAEQQLALIRAALSQLLGLTEGATDEEFAEKFDKYIQSATEEDGKEDEVEAAREAGRKEAEDYASKQHQTLVAKYEGALKHLNDKCQEMSSKLQSVEAEKMAAEAAKFSTEVESFVDGLVKEGKVLPAERNVNVEILKTADRNTLKFSDGHATQFDTMKAALVARPVILNFSELSKPVSEQEIKDAKEAQPVTRKVSVSDPVSIHRFSSADAAVDEVSAKVDSRTKEIMAEKKIGYGAAMTLASKELRK